EPDRRPPDAMGSAAASVTRRGRPMDRRCVGAARRTERQRRVAVDVLMQAALRAVGSLASLARRFVRCARSWVTPPKAAPTRPKAAPHGLRSSPTNVLRSSATHSARMAPGTRMQYDNRRMRARTIAAVIVGL